MNEEFGLAKEKCQQLVQENERLNDSLTLNHRTVTELKDLIAGQRLELQGREDATADHLEKVINHYFSYRYFIFNIFTIFLYFTVES